MMQSKADTIIQLSNLIDTSLSMVEKTFEKGDTLARWELAWAMLKTDWMTIIHIKEEADKIISKRTEDEVRRNVSRIKQD